MAYGDADAQGYEEIEARAASAYEHRSAPRGSASGAATTPSGSATSSNSTGRRSPRTARRSESGSTSSSSPRTAGSRATTRSSSRRWIGAAFLGEEEGSVGDDGLDACLRSEQKSPESKPSTGRLLPFVQLSGADASGPGACCCLLRQRRCSSSFPHGCTGHDAGARQLLCALGDRRMARCGRCRWWRSDDHFATRVGLEHMTTDTFCSMRPSYAPARRRRVVDLGGPPAARRCDDLKPC